MYHLKNKNASSLEEEQAVILIYEHLTVQKSMPQQITRN
jgi:hypothetical protein